MTPTPATEFPHGNPQLSAGALWASAAPANAARPRRMVLAVATPRRMILATCMLLDESAPAIEQSAPAAVPVAPCDDFGVYVSAMVTTLLAAGATRAASALQQWFQTGRFDTSVLDEPVRQSLSVAGYLEADRPSATAEETLAAWRAVLSGQSQDLSGCGDRTLDEWSAGLITALLGRSERTAGDIRRTLRRAGIAAFGVVAQAA